MVEKNQKSKIKNQNLGVKIGGLKLKNPIMLASGTFGCDMVELLDISKLGAVVTKTITLRPKAGNKPPRVVETPSGMLNSIGLENEGLEGLKKWLFRLKDFDTKIFVSIAGDTEREFIELIKELNNMNRIDAIELNISCPNIKTGLQFSQDEKATYGLVKKISNLTKKTLIVKLSPNVTDIRCIAKASEKAGADAVSLINTYLGMAVDIYTKRPLLGNITGGLSGPAIRPLALKAVWDVYNTVDIPIIGMGGIMDSYDAIEFIICGATAVAIGTGNFINPKVSLEIIDGIRYYMKAYGIGKLKELIGRLKL